MPQEKFTSYITADDLVKVKHIKNEIELTKITKCNFTPIVRRFKKGFHVNMETGEIIPDKVTVVRGQSLYNLHRANQTLRDLIKENVADYKKLLLLTLSYSPKESNPKKITEDFKRFIKRLRATLTGFGNIEYIYVLELYEDIINFHIHCILFFNKPVVNNSEKRELFTKLWGHGFVYVKQPSDDGFIYYLTPHTVKEVTEENKHIHQKALRQRHLPANLRFWRRSGGIKEPIEFTTNGTKAQEYITEAAAELVLAYSVTSPLKTSIGKPFRYVKERYRQIPKDTV